MTEDEKKRIRYSSLSTLPCPSSRTETDAHVSEKEQNQQSGDEDTNAPLSEKEQTQHTGDDAQAKDAPQDESTETKPKEKKTETPKPKAVDPIRMFGILVPPALRSAQASFRGAVDGPVVRLAEISGELRALEREIGRARKAVRRA